MLPACNPCCLTCTLIIVQDQEASTAGTSSPGSGSSGSPKRAGRRAGQLSSLGSSWEPDQVKQLERGWTNLAYKPVPDLKAESSKEVSSGVQWSRKEAVPTAWLSVR